MSEINYDNRHFVGVENYDSGDLNTDTSFHYHQKGSAVWGTIEGGRVAAGTLVARVEPDGSLVMRWHYLNIDGDFHWGTCRSIPKILPDGRLRLHESWTDNSSEEITGTSVIEEVP